MSDIHVGIRQTNGDGCGFLVGLGATIVTIGAIAVFISIALAGASQAAAANAQAQALRAAAQADAIRMRAEAELVRSQAQADGIAAGWQTLVMSLGVVAAVALFLGVCWLLWREQRIEAMQRPALRVVDVTPQVQPGPMLLTEGQPAVRLKKARRVQCVAVEVKR